MGHLRRNEYPLLVNAEDDSKQAQKGRALFLELLRNMRRSDLQQLLHICHAYSRGRVNSRGAVRGRRSEVQQWIGVVMERD